MVWRCQIGGGLLSRFLISQTTLHVHRNKFFVEHVVQQFSKLLRAKNHNAGCGQRHIFARIRRKCDPGFEAEENVFPHSKSLYYTLKSLCRRFLLNSKQQMLMLKKFAKSVPFTRKRSSCRERVRNCCESNLTLSSNFLLSSAVVADKNRRTRQRLLFSCKWTAKARKSGYEQILRKIHGSVSTKEQPRRQQLTEAI